MQWEDACAADQSGQAFREDAEGFWTVWTVQGVSDAMIERFGKGIPESRTVSIVECEQHDDWEPIHAIDAVTRLGELTR